MQRKRVISDANLRAFDAPGQGPLLSQGYFLLSFLSILAGFAGQFQGVFAVFAGGACKNSKHTPFCERRRREEGGEGNGPAFVKEQLILT